MIKVVLWFSAVMFALAVLFGIGWAVQGNDFLLYKAFAPKYEAVRRETFEQTKSYRQGMVQELQNMQFQYVQADDAHKEALADLILHRAADVDSETLPPALRAFISDIRNQRLGK